MILVTQQNMLRQDTLEALNERSILGSVSVFVIILSFYSDNWSKLICIEF